MQVGWRRLFAAVAVFLSAWCITATLAASSRSCVRFDPAAVAVGAEFTVTAGACAGTCMADPQASSFALFRSGGFESNIGPDCTIAFRFRSTNASQTVVGPGWSVGACCVTPTS